LPFIQINGFFNLGESFSGPISGTNFYSLRDVLSKNTGRHSLTFGIDFSLEKDIFFSNLVNWGMFTFDGAKTRNAFADFLLGTPTTMQQQTPAHEYENSFNFGGFVQDNYRILPNLTLNLGLRYDLQTVPTDPHDAFIAFTPGVQSTKVPSAPP